mmetsp:Transcript_26913/g.54671  ORF Transcript_26913/g.54671 Transcript_26913/m.54671 type:complete len:112 (+) Transcript_26913:152-487(+)
MQRAVSHKFLTRPIDRVVVVGRRASTDVHELVAATADASPAQTAACQEFAEVVASYRGGDFARCLALAAAYQHRYPTDVVAALYRDRCKQQLQLEQPPGPHWDCSYFIREK